MIIGLGIFVMIHAIVDFTNFRKIKVAMNEPLYIPIDVTLLDKHRVRYWIPSGHLPLHKESETFQSDKVLPRTHDQILAAV